MFVARVATRHPQLIALGAAACAVVALAGVLCRAKVKDRRAARAEPAGPGLIVGTTRGAWLFARRRPFYVPWTSLVQHVLICGPTGRGKTFTFVRPILEANTARSGTGVFYLDGKGDRIDYRVKVGNRVARGDVIATSGCTGRCFGDHLHFEVHTAATWSHQSAVDPMPYLRR